MAIAVGDAFSLLDRQALTDCLIRAADDLRTKHCSAPGLQNSNISSSSVLEHNLTDVESAQDGPQNVGNPEITAHDNNNGVLKHGLVRSVSTPELIGAPIMEHMTDQGRQSERLPQTSSKCKRVRVDRKDQGRTHRAISEVIAVADTKGENTQGGDGDGDGMSEEEEEKEKQDGTSEDEKTEAEKVHEDKDENETEASEDNGEDDAAMRGGKDKHGAGERRVHEPHQGSQQIEPRTEGKDTGAVDAIRRGRKGAGVRRKESRRYKRQSPVNTASVTTKKLPRETIVLPNAEHVPGNLPGTIPATDSSISESRITEHTDSIRDNERSSKRRAIIPPPSSVSSGSVSKLKRPTKKRSQIYELLLGNGNRSNG